MNRRMIVMVAMGAGFVTTVGAGELHDAAKGGDAEVANLLRQHKAAE
jgi:hypothetical protein